jgi:hypothetical protein
MYHWKPQHPAYPQHQDCYVGSSLVGHVTRYGHVWHASVGRDRLDNIEYPTIRAAQKAVEHAVTMRAWKAEREGPDPFP